MTMQYRISDFYYDILSILQDGTEGRAASEVIQIIFTNKNIEALRLPDLWNMFRLKVKNQIRLAHSHLALAGYVLPSQKNTETKGWQLSEKGKSFQGSEEELVRLVRLQVRKHVNENKSLFAIDEDGKIIRISNQRRAFSRQKKEVLPSSNTIFYGPPATGKTYQALKLALQIINKGASPSKNPYQQLRPELGGRLEIVAFHQSYTYEQFMAEPRGALWRLANRAKEHYGAYVSGETEDLQSYVLLIEGINRAHTAAIFGESLVLLDKDKRLGAAQEMRVLLSSGEYFAMPPNLFIIGTSYVLPQRLEQIDPTLREVFEFVPVFPRYDLPENKHNDFLEALNSLIAKDFGSNYLLGHAYFLDKEIDFMRLMNQKIIPLLTEQHSLKIVRQLLEHALEEAENTRGRFMLGIDTHGLLQMSRAIN